jgi:hypothetical protein
MRVYTFLSQFLLTLKSPKIDHNNRLNVKNIFLCKLKQIFKFSRIYMYRVRRNIMRITIRRLSAGVFLLRRKEIMHIVDSPYCVTLFPRTSVDLSCLEVRDFRMCFVLIYVYTPTDFVISNPVSRKLVLMDIVHSSTHITLT